MKILARKLTACLVCFAFALSGCVTNENAGPAAGGGLDIGPRLSSFFDAKREAEVDPGKPRLDIVVPVFDPGLSEEAENYTEDGVWPELRRAEANRFAWKLKEALEETGAFGAVRVTPDGTATGDLYVLGRIVESDGEEVEIGVDVVDIAGRRWFTRFFDHTVDEGFHKNPRNKGKDPYDPVFAEAANRIALELEDRDGERLEELRRITELRFGANFTEEAFSDHMQVEDDRVALVSFPAESDPMLRRTRAVRVRDQLYVDGLQETYRGFSRKMEDSYLVWQEQSRLELAAEREADNEAIGEAALGVLAIGLGVLAIAAGARSNSQTGSTAAVTGGILAGAAGAALISDSFQTSREAKFHREALEELGESIDVEMAPHVVAFEEKTVELTGNAKEQFAQWRAFLKEIYEQERTPDVQL